MELAKAYVQIIPSAKGIKNNLSKELNGETATVGESVGKTIGSKIKTAIVAAGIGKAISQIFTTSIVEGGKLQQSIGGIETLFKESAETMKRNAINAYKTAQLSANEYMEQATSFSAALIASLDNDTAKAATYADRAIVDMADNANKMGTSIESIQNAYQGFAKQNYTMLDNLKLGYGGTKTEMQRLIADSALLTKEQKELGVTIDTSDMSFANIVNSISVMQKHLGITGTTAQETDTTLQGSFNSMKAAYTNFLANMSLGNDIQSSIDALVSTSTNYLFKNLIPAIGNVIKILPSALGQFIVSGLTIGKELMDNVSNGFSQNVTNFINTAVPSITEFSYTLKEKSGKFVDAGLDLIMQLVQGIADGIPTLIENIPQIITNITGIINENAPKIIATGGQILITLAKGLISSIPVFISNLGNIVTALFSFWEAVNWINLGSKLIEGIKSGITKMGGSLKETASTLFNQLKENIGNIFTRIKEIITSPIFSAKTKVLSLVGELQTAAINVFKSLLNNAKNIFNNVKTAITSPINTAKNTIKGIVDTIKGFFSGMKITWPKIPMPHFSVKPKGWGVGDLLKGKIPTLGISWYAKAVDNPMKLEHASLFGMSNGQFLGGGEKGTEYITGEPGLTKIMSNVIEGSLNSLIEKQMSMLDIIVELLRIICEKDPNIVLDDGTLIGRLVDKINKELYKKKREELRGI